MLTLWLIMFVSLLSASLESRATEPRVGWKFSCYAYRDVDRSGIFDMGDRPFAGLALVLERRDGSEAIQFSNIDGFANFSTAIGEAPEIDAREPGEYEMRAELPAGWEMTSGSDTQTLRIREEKTVPGGLVITKACNPVGVAPELTIAGSVESLPDVDLADLDVSFTDDTGQIHHVQLDQRGRFSFAGRPGYWTFSVVHAASGLRRDRTIYLGRHSVMLSAIEWQAPPAAQSPLVRTLGFDDLVGIGGIFEVPTGYGGLNWTNWISVHNRFYDGAGYVNGTESGEFVAYNSSGTPGVVWSEDVFDFIGAHITVAWPRGEEGEVIVRAWRGDDLVHVDRLQLSPSGGVWFDANYNDITRLELSHELYERIVLDDFRFAR